MNQTKPKRSLWPAALFATFAVFISGIATLVTLSVRSDQDLVSDDYYEHEVRYQSQIDRESRTAAFAKELKVSYEPNAANVEVRLPVEHATKQPTGMVKLYRPSDARLDREFPLKVNQAGVQELDAASLQAGLWKLRVTWQIDGEEFYSENAIVIRHGHS